MRRLAGAHEHLDGALDDPAVLVGNLRDMRRANRLLGGVRLSRRALDALTLIEASRPIRLLDIGTGGADIPVALLADARRRGRRLEVVAIDAREEVLEAARTLRPALDRIAGLTLARADGLALPYPDDSFDVAHSSLVLHHFEPPDAVRLLAEQARVARCGVVVNDLTRGRLAWLGARLLAAVGTGNPYTRHDGPLSVRRAYVAAEIRELLAAAGLRPVAGFVGLAGHRRAIAAVRS